MLQNVDNYGISVTYTVLISLFVDMNDVITKS